MEVFNKLKNKATDLFNDLVVHWNRPANGNFVSFKEVKNYAIGGMGQNMVVYLLGYLGLSASNTLLGSTIGIRPMHLQYMAIIQTVVNIFITILRGKLVDNTRTKYGRFRPYIAFAGFPLVAMAVTFVFLPFETMAYTSKLLWVMLFALAITTMQPLLTDTYTELGSVITPNSRERANVMMIAILVYSFAPTVYGFVVPMILSGTGLTYTDINTYRYIIAPVAILGVGLNLFTALGCKERVVTSKTYVQKVGLLESFGAIYKNKYWWIRTIAGLVGFLENAFAVIFGWMYIYGTQDMAAYAVLTTLYGTASTIAMLATPYLLRKIGNRNILLLHNSMNILLLGIMMFTFKIPLLFFAILYINTAFNQLQLVYNPVLSAEVKDYQQYLTGKRVDFILGAAGQITVPISLATGLVLPFVYEAFGLTTNYDVLYDPLIRNNMFRILCLLSMVGAVMNLIPFFFYRLSREKHRMVILVLRERAALADFSNGAVEPELVKEVVEGVNFVEDIKATEKPDVKARFSDIITAYRLPKTTADEKTYRKEAIKAAKAAHREAVTLRENIEAVEEIYDHEQMKFDKPKLRLRLNIALAIAEYTPNGLLDLDADKLEYDMPDCLANERKRLLNLKNKYTKQIINMQTAIKKNYPNGVQKDYLKELHNALNIPYTNKEEAKIRDKAVENAEKELNKYNEVFKFYNVSKEMVTEYENRKYYEALAATYEDAVKEVSEREKALEYAEKAERESKKAEMEKNRAERFASFSPEKQAKILARRAKRAAKKPKADVQSDGDVKEKEGGEDENN